MQARITLVNQEGAPRSHTEMQGGRTLRRGESFITSSQTDVQYYRNQPGFDVTIIEPTTKVAAPKPTVKAPASKPRVSAPPPPPPEEEEEEEDDEGDEESEDEDDSDDEEEGEDEESEEETPKPLNVDSLKAMTKQTLLELAKERGLKLADNSSKADIIRAILKAAK